MIKKEERQQDILKILSKLDITPSMYKEATEKYEALAEYLQKHSGLRANMYSQGSFALGTVVRPYYKGANASYDLDFICEIGKERDEITPGELRSTIKSALLESKLYSDKVEEFDECFTIRYVNVNGASFSIDIVPATVENIATKTRLKTKTARPDLVDDAISIPKKVTTGYEWLTSNPQGFREWFQEINSPFLEYASAEFRAVLFESTDFYGSIEEIPHEMNRSSIQRVIQLLKYHRDIYYLKACELKPISALITYIVAEVASSLLPSIDPFTLLEDVLEQLALCEQQLHMNQVLFESTITKVPLIAYKNHIWQVINPANPEDNFADKWNTNSAIPIKFFNWVKTAKKDLIDSMILEDAEFRVCSNNAFSPDLVSSVWGSKYSTSAPKPITNTPKPWGIQSCIMSKF